MSSESECSCRVEGSGSQCNVLIQPNHQAVLVREQNTPAQTERQKGNKEMESNEGDGRQEERTVRRCYRWRRRDRGRETDRGEEQRVC